MTNKRSHSESSITVLDYFVGGALCFAAAGFLLLALSATFSTVAAAPTVSTVGAWAAITGLGGAVIAAVVMLLVDLSN